mmetsp:Transcript_2138/g.4509  ORF Transcript_2138/g.4509 Transcript_2138/m.4509 type:complete len:297 (-) Transcript_2138:257-1147(-)
MPVCSRPPSAFWVGLRGAVGNPSPGRREPAGEDALVEGHADCVILCHSVVELRLHVPMSPQRFSDVPPQALLRVQLDRFEPPHVIRGVEHEPDHSPRLVHTEGESRQDDSLDDQPVRVRGKERTPSSEGGFSRFRLFEEHHGARRDAGGSVERCDCRRVRVKESEESVFLVRCLPGRVARVQRRAREPPESHVCHYGILALHWFLKLAMPLHSAVHYCDLPLERKESGDNEGKRECAPESRRRRCPLSDFWRNLGKHQLTEDSAAPEPPSCHSAVVQEPLPGSLTCGREVFKLENP